MQAASLGKYGAAKVFVVDAPAYAPYSAEGYAAALAACAAKADPDVVLLAGSAMGRTSRRDTPPGSAPASPPTSSSSKCDGGKLQVVRPVLLRQGPRRSSSS